MGNTKPKRIGTFAEFCKQTNSKLIKENNEIAIDVPFYQDAIDSVLGDLKCVAGDPINWDTLVEYTKAKFLAIDRDVPNDENQVIAHIKDLLFQRYGDTILGGDVGCLSYDSAQIGVKTLVISQLATEILNKVRVNAGLDEEPVPEMDPKPKAKVYLGYDDYDDYDLPFEKRQVAGFNDFSSMLKESVNKLTVNNDDKALDYCLNKIENDAGSLHLDDIMKVVEKNGFKDLEAFLSSIVKEYLKDTSIKLNGVKLKNKGDEKPLLKVAKKMFEYEITRQLMDTIQKETLKK